VLVLIQFLSVFNSKGPHSINLRSNFKPPLSYTLKVHRNLSVLVFSLLINCVKHENRVRREGNDTLYLTVLG
jgi:hypothetical protein